MLNDNAKKWIAALRSGKFTQGRQYLNHNGKLCCLGVACEVAIANGVELTKAVTDFGAVKYDLQLGELPQKVRSWLGLSSVAGGFQNNDGSLTSLVTKNDHAQLNFKAIADLIESQPKGLFKEGD